jgi:hypothetical protein
MTAFGLSVPALSPGELAAGHNEAGTQSRRVLRAARLGGALWRNNSGACQDETGRQIRYGLGNISSQVNKVMKSSDLIGITPIIVTPDMIGQRLGIFTAEEIKRPDWKFRQSDERAVAQFNFIKKVISLGGIAKFVNSEDSP